MSRALLIPPASPTSDSQIEHAVAVLREHMGQEWSITVTHGDLITDDDHRRVDRITRLAASSPTLVSVAKTDTWHRYTFAAGEGDLAVLAIEQLALNIGKSFWRTSISFGDKR